jgi:hypothetical protein
MMPDEAIEVFRLSRAERRITSTTSAVRMASIKRLRGMETEGGRVVRAGDMVWKRPSAIALAAMEPLT